MLDSAGGWIIIERIFRPARGSALNFLLDGEERYGEASSIRVTLN